MTTAQQEIQSVIDDLSAKIADLETRSAALKDLRYHARNVLSKYEPNQFVEKSTIDRTSGGVVDGVYFVGMTAQEAIEFEDKELPSSGIYGDEGYTEADKAAASLDPALVDLCSNTTIHANSSGWFLHVGDQCPIAENKMVEIETVCGDRQTAFAHSIVWAGSDSVDDITRWRYAK